jgi:CTP:molybdopterin cytidylyltransferase MocA
MSHSTLSILIPAAGASERLGQAKQLVQHQGTSLLQNAVNTAHSIDPLEIIVVTGANANAVKETVTHTPVRWVHNPDWSTGMGGSIALGAVAISPASTGLMILLCDQWRIQTIDLQKLAEAWQSDPERIVCARAEGINMPPVIFPVACFSELRQLQGPGGARGLIDKNSDLLYSMQTENAVFDLDTRVQLKNLE